MNELLQKHGCSNVFTVPEGLKELMADITREVLRDQPPKIYDYIANYLSVLIITREHGILAVKILEDLCDCRPTVSEHLLQIGMERDQADAIAQIIQEEIERNEPVEGKEKVKEAHILKKILNRSVLDEELSAKVCQVARNAYRDYWYRKKLIEKNLKVHPEEPWEIAAQHTLELYKKTKPSFSELTRASQKIQAAYRGYHVRRNVLRHLKPKPKKSGPKAELPGPPIDVAGSREIDLGPVIVLNVREENVNAIFDNRAGERIGVQYDPMKTITHLDDAFFDNVKPPFDDPKPPAKGQRPSRAHSYTAGMPIKSIHSQEEPTHEAPVPRRGAVTAEVTPRRSRISNVTPQSTAEPSKIVFAEPQSTYLVTADVTPRKGPISFVTSPTVHSSAEPSIQKIAFAEKPAIALIEALEIPEDLSVDPDLSDRTAADGDSVPTDTTPRALPASEDIGNVTDAEDIPEDLPNDEPRTPDINQDLIDDEPQNSDMNQDLIDDEPQNSDVNQDLIDDEPKNSDSN